MSTFTNPTRTDATFTNPTRTDDACAAGMEGGGERKRRRRAKRKHVAALFCLRN